MEKLLKPLKIGTLKLKGNILLAPLAGWSDAAFRYICIKWGAFFTYTEMVSSEACARNSEKTFKLFVRAKNEKKLGFQIFASSPETAAICVKKIIKYKPSLIDLNCGCSINKVLKTGSGASLLKSPLKIMQIIKAMKNETDVPVTVKLRSGWDSDTINYIKTAEYAVKGGADLITLHPRTKTQFFSGKVELKYLAELKKNISVPVIGSGDLFTAGDIRNMLMKTTCDGVMIGRGSFGNPFIFKDTIHLLKNKKHSRKPASKKRLQTALNQLKIMSKVKGEKLACIEMRKHMCSYSKGIKGSSELRKKIVRAATTCEYESIIKEFLNNK